MSSNPLNPNPNRQKVVKYALYGALSVIFFAVCYLLFAPDSSSDSAELNTELPEAEDELLPGAKSKAYEDAAGEHISSQLHSLDEDFNMLPSAAADTAPAADSPEAQREASEAQLRAVSEAARATALDMQQQQRSAASSGGSSASDEVERLRRENEELRHKKVLEESEQRRTEAQAMVQEILRQAQPQQQVEQAQAPSGEAEEGDRNATTVSPVTENVDAIATSLTSSTRRSNGFYGIGSSPAQKNTIRALVYGKQTISEGQNLRFRLAEPMVVAGQVVPANALLIGVGRISVDRLFVSITSVEFEGVITKIALEVFDADGQQGLFLPGSMELEAAREIGSDVANAVGSSASSNVSMFTQQSAAEQIKADVGRGVVQGTFRYVGRKLQQVKVTVQDKHKVFLVPQR